MATPKSRWCCPWRSGWVRGGGRGLSVPDGLVTCLAPHDGSPAVTSGSLARAWRSRAGRRRGRSGRGPNPARPARAAAGPRPERWSLRVLLAGSSGHPAASSSLEGAVATSPESISSSSSQPSRAAARFPRSPRSPRSRESARRRFPGTPRRAPRLLLLADPSSAGWAFSRGAPGFRPGADGPGQRSQVIGRRGSGV